MDRSIGEIFDQVLAAIPEEEVHFFDNFLSKLPFTAPEMLPYRLDEFVHLFNRLVPNPPYEDWHYNAISALTTKSVEEIKKEFS